jgi:predicted ATPase
MLTRFSVKNYKCLADVSLPLTPLHVLIGQNDAGKTSLLEAMLAFYRSSRMPLAQAFPGKWEGRELVFHGSSNAQIGFSAEWTQSRAEEGDTGAARYGFTVQFSQAGRDCRCVQESAECDGTGEHVVRTNDSCTRLQRHATAAVSDENMQQQLAPITQQMGSVQMYRFDAKLMAVPAAISETRKFRMDPDGFGLPSLLDDLLGYDPNIFLHLSHEFCTFFPQFSRVRIEAEPAVDRRYDETGIHSTSTATGKGIYFETAGGETVRAQQASDGAILFLGFLALAYLPKPPKLLLIEEPENGIYPKRLEEVVGLLRKLHERGSKIEFPQIVLTTHSPYLLSQFQPEEVTFLARQPDGGVRAYPLRDVPNIRERLDGFYLGELWYNLTEEELLHHVTS